MRTRSTYPRQTRPNHCAFARSGVIPAMAWMISIAWTACGSAPDLDRGMPSPPMDRAETATLGPVAAQATLQEPAFDCVFAVEDARALRGALEHRKPSTEIRLVRGTFVLEGPLALPEEPTERLRIVGQGAEETFLTWRDAQAMLVFASDQHPLEVDLVDLTLRCPDSSFLRSTGDGVLSLSGTSFEGPLLADAERWVVRVHPATANASPPTCNATVQPWEGIRTR